MVLGLQCGRHRAVPEITVRVTTSGNVSTLQCGRHRAVPEMGAALVAVGVIVSLQCGRHRAVPEIKRIEVGSTIRSVASMWPAPRGPGNYQRSASFL